MYFTLKRGALRGDPISAYLFIFALKVFFVFIKNKVDIKGIDLFDHTFLFTAYAGDSTLKIKTVKILIETYWKIIEKCEITGFTHLEEVLEAVCGLKTADLSNDAIKVLRTHFSYHNKSKAEWKLLSTVKDMQNALNVRNARILTLEGRILIFKTLRLSKFVNLSLIATVSNSILNEIQKIKKAFLWCSTKPKTNHKTLCNMFEEGGLKNVDTNAKIISL